jgi:hypothetical protein
MKNKKYFCYEIYKNLAIWSHNGKLGYNPCSFYSGYIKTSSEFDLAGVWNSPEHLELKKCVETDTRIPGCQACYSAEDSGIESRRQGSKKLYEEFHQDVDINLTGPTGIDYSVGNLCNLKCVICGPNHSSQWVPDYQKLHPTIDIVPFQHRKNHQLEITDPELLKSIKQVHFHGGGEPLLSENHVRLLQKIQEVKGLADVRVFYNTNGTQTVPDKILQLWEQCRLIELYFSVDDVGNRFDYQRTGTDWNKVTATMNWFYANMPHNHMFNVNCTWSYLNFFYLNEVWDWWNENFSLNRYGDSTNLIFQKANGNFKFNHVSQSCHDILQHKFQDYNQLLTLLKSLKISDQPHDNFWKNILALDQIRGTNFKTVHPEWSELLL